MQSLSDVAVFLEVVDRQSFTAAADSLSLSKSVVSKYVRRLEARLGVRLLNRTTRRLTLTEAGETLYQRTRGAVAELAAAEEEILTFAGRPRGRLRVTAAANFGVAYLAPRIAGFLRRYPEIELDLDLDNRFVDLVRERFDVAIRISSPVSSSLVARRLADVHLATVASPDYLAGRGEPKTPAALAGHECLIAPGAAAAEWHFRLPRGEALTVRVRGRFRCNDDDMLRQAAIDGVGILYIPKLFVEHELRNGSLVCVLEKYALPPASLSAVFPTRAGLPAKVRVFVDFLAEQFHDVSQA